MQVAVWSWCDLTRLGHHPAIAVTLLWTTPTLGSRLSSHFACWTHIARFTMLAASSLRSALSRRSSILTQGSRRAASTATATANQNNAATKLALAAAGVALVGSTLVAPTEVCTYV